MGPSCAAGWRAGAWVQTVGDAALRLPLFLTPKSRVGQDKVLKELDAAIDVETIKLRELRYKMVDAGVYKSWCAAPMRGPAPRRTAALLHGPRRDCARARLTRRLLPCASRFTQRMAATSASQVPGGAQGIISQAGPQEWSRPSRCMRS